ncbi:MAG: hypothetical protein ABI679_03090 [Gemmatimonadota bacterium]
MTTTRPTPFDLVFDNLSKDRFPEIKNSLAEGSVDPANRDAFLLNRFVVQVLRDIVPDEGVGEAVDQHVALLHNAYLFWARGTRVVRLNREQTEGLLKAPPPDALSAGSATPYVQFPERTIWAQINEGFPHEPLDGVFVTRPGQDQYRVLGIFGMHPDRIGFSVAEVAGSRMHHAIRPDGSSVFAPVLPGGSEANLFSVDGASELIELGARTLSVAQGGSGKDKAPGVEEKLH